MVEKAESLKSGFSALLRREDYEEWEERELAPYAVKSRLSGGRVHPEKEHEYRTRFQRDKDRILHSTAFRRLEYKTQVFVNHEGDHYRTRLTHTLEVAQIARTMARILRLNEDLAEAISLAHDLGHGPFGHAGEKALADMMKGHGGFEHNAQSLRIVEVLEESYPEFPGLNLTHEVLEGMKKHGSAGWLGKKKSFSAILEGQIADIADEIAYDSHDLDDGLRSGLVPEQALQEVAVWREHTQYIEAKYKGIEDHHKKRMVIRLLINQQVNDVCQQTLKNLEVHSIRSLEDVNACEKKLVEFSTALTPLKAELRKFLMKNLYSHYRVVRMTEKGERFIKSIFSVYLERPEQLPPSVARRAEKDGIQRCICDYIAGMTDRFALDEYKRLFEPYERV